MKTMRYEMSKELEFDIEKWCEDTAYDELSLESLESKAEQAKKIADEEKEREKRAEEEYEEGTLSRFFGIIKRDAKRFKNEILIIGCYIIFAVNLFYVAGTGLWDFFRINPEFRTHNHPVLAVTECLLPLLVWVWSSKYSAFNYYRVKFLTFGFCILNWIALTMDCLRIALMRCFRIVFFSIPTGGSLRPAVLVLGFYVFTGSVLFFTSLAVCLRARKSMVEKIMYRKIVRFRIAKILPEMPWKRRFSYDMCIVRNLITGKMHRIYEDDRRLHSKGVGSTGGGKTATILTVSYEADLKRKAKNIDYQKKKVKKLLDEGKAYLTCDFEDIDFNIDYVKPEPQLDIDTYKKVEEYLRNLKYTAKNAGITVMCPNEAFSDELYKKAKAKKLRINRVDPCMNEDGTHKEDFIGFSPIYVPVIEGESEDNYMFRVFTAAKLYADVNQAIFILSGKDDPYFTGLNKNLSVTAAVTVIIAYPLLYPGEYATIEQVQNIMNDFKQIKPYRDALIDRYGKKNEVGVVVKRAGSVDVGPNLQFIIDRIDRDFLGPNSVKINEQATGLRNIIDESLMNPRIRKILCAKKSLNLDRALEMGELTLVNFEISLGSDSTGFGMFFMLSFIQAVLRRPGELGTRLPHFFAIDEAPMLFHPRLELCTTLFRQYNVSMLLFMQSLTQYEKNDTTRYLKNVLTGNCAHQIIFGRASREDMEFYEKLSGYKYEMEESESVRETSLTDADTSQQFTHSFELEQLERISTDDIRYRDFLECTVFSTQHSTPLEPFLGKTNFLPRGYDPRMKRYRVDWSKYYSFAGIAESADEKAVVGYVKDGATTSIKDICYFEADGEVTEIDPDMPLFLSGPAVVPEEEEDVAESFGAPAEEEETVEVTEADNTPDMFDNDDEWEEF